MHRLIVLICFFLLIAFAGLASGAEKETAEKSGIQAEIRFLYVQPGQTLHNIVRRLYPNKRTEWPRLRQDIVRLNPHAFVDADETKMIAGVRIELPRKMVIKKKVKKTPKQVGDVVIARGQTIAVGEDKLSRKLAIGDSVYLGDRLITGADGFLRLRMIDDALLDLRCYSIMVIEDYNLAPSSRTSVINLLQGSMRKVTGGIGKWTEDVYELKTPIASVGVRGTEYALRVFQSRGCDGSVDVGDDGLYIKVIDGLVDVHNDAQSTIVVKDQTLYIPEPERKPEPKVIPPGTFEPAPVEEPPVEVVEVKEEESESGWWWAIGGALLVGLALL